MQAAKFTFVQIDRPDHPALSDRNEGPSICPGQFEVILAKYARMFAPTSLFVLDKLQACQLLCNRRVRRNPPRTRMVDAVVHGTSGAESVLNEYPMASAPPRRRARRGASAGFLAAQLRWVSFETSRELLLLPPSLVRSGTLRSDIYAPRPTLRRRAARIPVCRAKAAA